MRAAIVHLSDIHFRAANNPIEARLPQLAAAICSTDPTCTEYLVLLSGDIADTGQEVEYETAKAFFNDLTSAISQRQPGCNIRYFTIPGNHDCYLPEAEIHLRDA